MDKPKPEPDQALRRIIETLAGEPGGPPESDRETLDRLWSRALVDAGMVGLREHVDAAIRRALAAHEQMKLPYCATDVSLGRGHPFLQAAHTHREAIAELRRLVAEQETKAATLRLAVGEGVAMGMGQRKDRALVKKAWLPAAMMLVNEHPEWSDARIAREVRVDRAQLSRDKTYQRAALIARNQGPEPPRGRVQIDPDTGERSLEAFDEEDRHE